MAKLHEKLRSTYQRFLGKGSPGAGPIWLRLIRLVNDTLWQEEKIRQKLEQTAEENARAAHQRLLHLRAVVDTFPDVFILLDKNHLILECTGSALPLLSSSPQAHWVCKPISDFPHPEHGALLAEGAQSAREKPSASPAREFSISSSSGTVHFEARFRVLENGQTIVLIQDISDRKRALETLKLSEERYALATQASHDGLWDWNMLTNRIYFSPRWKAILGYQDTELGNDPHSWWDRIHPEDIDLVRRALDYLGQNGKDTVDIEYRIRHRDQSYRWVSARGMAVRDGTGRIGRLVGAQTDITQRKEAEERLLHEGFHDKITGLANRSLFMDRLHNVLDRVKRQPGYLIAVIYVDLDRFSAVNERLGHAPANRLLEAVAARLRSFARVGDTVARLGDDEFAILLDGIPNDRAAVIFADRMRELIATPCDIGPEEITVTASLGITINSGEASTPESMLNEAESAMQRAKQAGKNCQELFSRENYSRLVSKLRVETELRRAADRDELELYYQPIFRLSDKKLTRLEALIRWNHPQRGLVSPLEFIPIAEETGLIISIGDWVVNAACAQAQAWAEAGRGHVAIAVNVSPRQFQQPNILTLFGAAFAKMAPHHFALEVEITEGAAMHDVDQSVKVLRSLRDMGLRISIDDFGVGYSSLSCLRLFPLNTLKVDRGFVQGVPHAKDNTALTNAIIAIAHNLGLSVVAEGVESEEQLAHLRDQGCEEAQGHLLGRPIPAKDMTSLLPPK